MQACQTGAAEGFKGRAEKLLNIFQSDLFQALLDIQEFYELTVCENQKVDGTPNMRYRSHADETPPLEDCSGQVTTSSGQVTTSSGQTTTSSGHMTTGQSGDSTDGYTQPVTTFTL
ncbi:hypothetical protein NHX12_013669 [Muraenolepis orangiensis]|uniref:L27 domain-containing protein n=1 Tax=Muraenolepis orangiensis TaxID=630683 RepID=A0A9Q0DAR1_9TELE|nr:hypothetical protein NHX12_013669 [Muraenolepis orangiensis]